MSKETMVCILGVVVFFTPFLGLPRTSKDWVLIVVGVVLAFVGYRLRRIAFLKSLDDGNGGKRTEVFVESRGTVLPPPEEPKGPILHV